MFMTCSSHVHKLFTSFPKLVCELFMSCSVIVHDFFSSWHVHLVHDLFIFCSCLVPDIFMVYLWLFSLILFLTSSQLIHALLTIGLQFVHDLIKIIYDFYILFHILSMTCSQNVQKFSQFFKTCSWFFHEILNLTKLLIIRPS